MLQEVVYRIPEENILERTEGQFAKKIFVLVLKETNIPGNRAFLAKVLSAAGIELAQDTALVLADAGEILSLLPILHQKQAEKVLVFGFTPESIGLRLNATFYKPFIFYQATWLFADALSVLEPDRTLKGQLWTALKQIFLSA
jgi:hypothetical protein